MQLELKHIAPYLPYGLECIYSGYGKESEERANITAVINDKSGWEVRVQTESGIIDEDVLFYCKPTLRPLSDLTSEIEHNGEKIVPIEYISTSKAVSQRIMRRVCNEQSLDNLEYWQAERLFELHFDIFNLIPAGLAIDINEINK